MKTRNQHPQVILLLGKKKSRQDEVDKWLADGPYRAREANDVFEALEEVSDFTVGDFPDVVFLHADQIEADLELLNTVLSAGQCVSVIAFSDQDAKKDNLYDLGLPGLARQLDRLIPGGSRAV